MRCEQTDYSRPGLWVGLLTASGTTVSPDYGPESEQVEPHLNLRDQLLQNRWSLVLLWQLVSDAGFALLAE